VLGLTDLANNATGIGANSGEVTLVIKPDAGSIVEVFAGILGSQHPNPNGIEQGVYASYVNVALAAVSSGRQLSCRFLKLDKNRITGLTILEQLTRYEAIAASSAACPTATLVDAAMTQRMC
jgi:hypothetical protein